MTDTTELPQSLRRRRIWNMPPPRREQTVEQTTTISRNTLQFATRLSRLESLEQEVENQIRDLQQTIYQLADQDNNNRTDNEAADDASMRAGLSGGGRAASAKPGGVVGRVAGTR